MLHVGAAVKRKVRLWHDAVPDGLAVFAERNQAHPIVAASGALVGLSFQWCFEIAGLANCGKLSDSPINLSVPAHPVRLPSREMCWRSGMTNSHYRWVIVA